MVHNTPPPTPPKYYFPFFVRASVAPHSHSNISSTHITWLVVFPVHNHHTLAHRFPGPSFRITKRAYGYQIGRKEVCVWSPSKATSAGTGSSSIGKCVRLPSLTRRRRFARKMWWRCWRRWGLQASIVRTVSRCFSCIRLHLEFKFEMLAGCGLN